MPHPVREMVAELLLWSAEGPKEHVADLYNESGPGGEGALGSEPACSLHLFSCIPAGPGAGVP